MQKEFNLIKSIFLRNCVLYLAAAIVMAFLMNPKQAVVSYLNRLKEVEIYLHDFSLGKEHYSRELFTSGVRYYSELIHLNESVDIFHGNLGYCYFQLGDYRSAIGAYQRAAELSP